jgi:glycosyltransferase involved in cell wall biosynthesis
MAHGLLERDNETYALSGWIASMASSIITHSNWGNRFIKNFSAGQTTVIPLIPSQKLLSNSVSFSKENESFNVITFGEINGNKRVASVIRGISSNPQLTKNAVYKVIGKIEKTKATELEQLALELKVSIQIKGQVSDSDLHDLIDSASAIACLRLPVLEASSASLMESLFYGKATLVTDIGCYQEIPDNCVVKVSIENEIEDIQSGLSLLMNDVDYRIQLARNGRDWARSNHDIGNIIDAIENVFLLQARIYFQTTLIREVSGQLADWCPNGIPEETFGILGGRIDYLFETN